MQKEEKGNKSNSGLRAVSNFGDGDSVAREILARAQNFESAPPRDVSPRGRRFFTRARVLRRIYQN